MKKPIIGITSGWEPGIHVEGWPTIYVNKDLTDNIYENGGIPLIIPVTHNFNALEEAILNCDGIILSGETLSIKRNVLIEGEENQLRKSNPYRYDYEYNLIKLALKKKIPLMGICRGFQVLNVVAGGKFTDYDIHMIKGVCHQQQGIKNPNEGIHSITILEESKLRKIIGKEKILVNSFHRQGMEKLAPNFIATAFSEDNNIEAIEYDGDLLIWGFQFHPEMFQDKEFKNIFKEFINELKN